jgi:hypothetical protein
MTLAASHPLVIYRVELACDHDLVIAATTRDEAARLASDWARLHGTTVHAPPKPARIDEPAILAVDAVMD